MGCRPTRKLARPVNTWAFDRHRGGGHPPTPATPPCVRVRTRRFELVTLASIDQRWKSERFEVSIGKPHREGFGPGQIPGAESAASRVAGLAAVALASSLGLDLHQVGQRTFNSKLLSMPSTRRSRWRGGRCA